MLSSAHPWASRQAIPIELFATEPFIDVFPGQESDNSRTLARYGISPNVRFSVFDAQAAHELVAANLGITLMNEIYVRDMPGRMVALPLEPRTVIDIGIAMPHDQRLSPAVRAFADFTIPRFETMH